MGLKTKISDIGRALSQGEDTEADNLKLVKYHLGNLKDHDNGIGSN